jgi:hypothetical protein
MWHHFDVFLYGDYHVLVMQSDVVNVLKERKTQRTKAKEGWRLTPITRRIFTQYTLFLSPIHNSAST